MSLALLPSLIALLAGCSPKATDSGADSAADTDTDTDDDTDTDTDSDTDTDTNADSNADTAPNVFDYEGAADLTATTWTGSESIVVYDVTSMAETCRVTNPSTGAPGTESCPECTFLFDLSWGTGSLSGDGCATTGMSAADHDGESWVYGFAPTHAYSYGGYDYTQSNVLGYYYSGYMYFWADATVNADSTHIDYRSMSLAPGYYGY